MTDFILKDSGARRAFDTGAHRDVATGKGRYDLIPLVPLRRLAQLLERGAVKYGDRNWEKGMPLRVFLDSAMRHLVATMEGQEDEDHPAQAVWNIMAFMQTLEWLRCGRRPESLAAGTVYESRLIVDASPFVDAADFENGPCRTPLVPTSLGVPVVARAGTSGPAAGPSVTIETIDGPRVLSPESSRLLDEIRAADAARDKGRDTFDCRPF